MVTESAQSIQNTCTASSNIIDVGSNREVVCESDAQDRDAYSFEALYNGWW